MRIVYNIFIILGLIVFLTGYWFLAKSSGQGDCNKKDTLSFIGGILGFIFGIMIVIVTIFINKINAGMVSVGQK